MFYSNFGHIFIVSALQSILCRNDLAEQLWPLNDSEGQSGSPPKWNHLHTGPRPTFGEKFYVQRCITICVRLHTDRMTNRPTWSHNLCLGGGNNNNGRIWIASQRSCSTARHAMVLSVGLSVCLSVCQSVPDAATTRLVTQFRWRTCIHTHGDGSMGGGQGRRPPVKFLPPVPLPPPKKVQDKAVTCQNFQKACSALVVILMLSCFVTF